MSNQICIIEKNPQEKSKQLKDISNSIQYQTLKCRKREEKMSTWKMHLANFVYDVKFNIFHEEGRTALWARASNKVKKPQT